MPATAWNRLDGLGYRRFISAGINIRLTLSTLTLSVACQAAKYSVVRSHVRYGKRENKKQTRHGGTAK